MVIISGENGPKDLGDRPIEVLDPGQKLTQDRLQFIK